LQKHLYTPAFKKRQVTMPKESEKEDLVQDVENFEELFDESILEDLDSMKD